MHPAHTSWLGWDLGRFCWWNTQPSPPDIDLRLALKSALINTPFTNVDHSGKGMLTLADFQESFGAVAGENEVTAIFEFLRQRDPRPGGIAFGAYVTFQEELRSQCLKKAGDPKYLEYGSLLEGVVLSCSRPDFTERLGQEPFPPSPQWLLQEMAKEWGDSLLPHWQYASGPVPWKEEERQYPDWEGGYSVRDNNHLGMALEDFCRMAEAQAAGLTEPEVLGLRLYTGPGYRHINCSLRANSGRFPVTQFCIDSAVGKLAHSAPAQPLMRGLRKPMPNRWARMYEWYGGVRHRRLALSDPGFVSTTTDPKVATGTDFGGPVLFLLHTATATQPDLNRPYAYLSHGADVQWVSQYPSEAEILLPSNAILIPRWRCKHRARPELPFSPGLAPEKAVYEFRVFYPWDPRTNCPLVYDNKVPTLLKCVNSLLDVIHHLELGLLQECRRGHQLPPAHHDLHLSVLPTPPADGEFTQMEDVGAKYRLDRDLSMTAPYPEPMDPTSPCSTIELISPHGMHHFQLGCSTLNTSFTPGALPESSSLQFPESDTVIPFTGSFHQSSWSNWNRLPHALQGTNALCHSRLPYYTEADVLAALAKLRSRQRLSDTPAVGGGDYPLEPAVASPFHRSAWKLGLWGLFTAGLGAVAGALGITLCGAGGAVSTVGAVTVTVSMVVVTSVVAVSVPLTIESTDIVAPVVSPSPSPSSSPSPSPSPTTSPSPSPSPSSSSSSSPSPTASPSLSPSPSSSSSPGPSPTASPSPSPSSSSSPSPSPSPRNNMFGTGSNWRGQLGYMNAYALNLYSLTPLYSNVINSALVSNVAAGKEHTLLVMGGIIYAMGDNNNGALGFSSPYYSWNWTVPMNSTAWDDARVQGIAAGDSYSVVLAGDSVYATGANNFGQLGIGTVNNSHVPVPMLSTYWGGAAVTSVSASKGGYHTMLIAGGRVYGTGLNAAGQLGTGNSTSHLLPVPMTMFVPDGDVGGMVVFVATGAWHTLLIADGKVFGTGNNSVGQLGLGPETYYYPYHFYLVAANVSTIQNATVTAIAVGSDFALLIAGGTAYCTGQVDTYDEIRYQFQKVNATAWGDAEVTAVAAGYHHALLIAGGSVYGFGSNDQGQLGTGNTIRVPLPVRMNTSILGAAVVISMDGADSVTLLLTN
eukprot:EG_transcript_709